MDISKNQWRSTGGKNGSRTPKNFRPLPRERDWYAWGRNFMVLLTISKVKRVQTSADNTKLNTNLTVQAIIIDPAWGLEQVKPKIMAKNHFTLSKISSINLSRNHFQLKLREKSLYCCGICQLFIANHTPFPSKQVKDTRTLKKCQKFN